MKDFLDSIGDSGYTDQVAPENNTHPFRYQTDRFAWEAVKVGKGVFWLPMLTKFVMQPGVNLVGKNDRGQLMLGKAVAHIKSKGGDLLKLSTAELVGEKSYMVQEQNTAGQNCYRELWATPFNIQGRTVYEFDHEKFNQYRFQLVAKGVVKQPHKHAIISAKQKMQYTHNVLVDNDKVSKTSNRWKRAKRDYDLAESAKLVPLASA